MSHPMHLKLFGHVITWQYTSLLASLSSLNYSSGSRIGRWGIESGKGHGGSRLRSLVIWEHVCVIIIPVSWGHLVKNKLKLVNVTFLPSYKLCYRVCFGLLLFVLQMSRPTDLEAVPATALSHCTADIHPASFTFALLLVVCFSSIHYSSCEISLL